MCLVPVQLFRFMGGLMTVSSPPSTDVENVADLPFGRAAHARGVLDEADEVRAAEGVVTSARDAPYSVNVTMPSGDRFA
jgi:hypothetical protein